jgi:hypothetical protein
VIVIGGGDICAIAPLADKSRIAVSTIAAARFVVMAESYVLLAVFWGLHLTVRQMRRDQDYARLFQL